ncbi:MAG: DUF4105 domain-containing protein [Prevotella sp.]|nr:DUF4105 domain-containing protein [Prevotella sp.]MCM1075414.1 DUF4105 domain-containing protein [Ruminococcus sp.]
MKRQILFLTLLLTACFGLRARSEQLTDSLSIGFVTCYPGPEIFELYGHEGVRVSGTVNGEPIDVVFNYGLFDFSSPGFISRFVKGETDYNIGASPTALFLYPYRERGSKVVERKLPLSQDEALQMYNALLNDIRPGNNTYRYKYFSANCATKPIDHLNRITGSRFAPKDAAGITYRNVLEEYNAGYPWYQFGIDLVLGSELDKPITYAQTTFVPMETDSRYFGSMPENVLVKGEGDGNHRSAPTPGFFSPLFVFRVVFAIALLFAVKSVYRHYFAPVESLRKDVARRSVIKIQIALWCLLQGLAGLLVCYLTFFSEHEGTSPNFNAIWLNPLWLLITLLIWIPACLKIVKVLCIADAVVTLLLLCIWAALPQAINPAQIPLMLTTGIITLQSLLLTRR